MTDPPEKSRVLPLALLGGSTSGVAMTVLALTPAPWVPEPARLPALFASAASGLLSLTLATSHARVQIAKNKTARLRERVAQRELEATLAGAAEGISPQKGPRLSGLEDWRGRSG